MSIKKLLGKVVGGAAVGALVIVGASSVVMAANPVHPGGGTGGTGLFSQGTLTNTAEELPYAKAEMKIQMDLQRRAYLYPQEPLAIDAAAAIDTLQNVIGAYDPTDPTGVPVGNVGRLWVETNYLGWDIVATLRNGGWLRKVLDEPELVDEEYETCVTINFAGDVECTTTPAVYKTTGDSLVFVANAGNGGLVHPCSLEIGIGVVTIPGGTGSMLNAGFANVEVEAKLDFSADNFPPPTGTPPVKAPKWASFAKAIGEEMNTTGSNLTDDETLSAFGSKGVTSGSTPAYDIKDIGFPLITAGRRVDLAGFFGEENKGDYAIQFYINARIDKDQDELLMGNKPGIYEETLEFQLFGVY